MTTKIEIQYSTASSFLRACRFAFNESRDRHLITDRPCPEEWVILAVYDYLTGKNLPISFIRNPIGIMSKFQVVASGCAGSYMTVVASSPDGNKILIA